MNPNYTPPAPPPAPLPNGNNNQYDFIMNSNQPKKGLGFGLSGGSLKQRLIIVAVAGLILLILMIVVFSLIFSGGNSSTEKLIDLAQQQNEIVRVADLGTQKATSSATKNFARTTKLTVLSSQQDTLGLLAKKGHKLKQKQLRLKQNSTVDNQLNDAAANNTFDSTFTRVLTDELNSYRQSLQSEFKASNSTAEKQILKDSFDGVTMLIADKNS